MRNILLLCCFFPLLCSAQRFPTATFEARQEGDAAIHTYWQVLQRHTARNPITTFFRISKTGNEYALDVKLMQYDETFAVARNAVLELQLHNGDMVTLHNAAYRQSCKGCGARADDGDNDKQGVALSFPLGEEDIEALTNNYVIHTRLQMAGGFIGARVSDDHNFVLMDELKFACSIKNNRTDN